MIPSAKLRQALGTILVLVALALPVTTHARTTISFTTPAALKIGLSPIANAILSLAVRGSAVINGGNVVFNTGANPNGCLVHGTKATFCPAFSNYTASGGNVKVNSGAKYIAAQLTSPYNSTASARGLRTGSGVVTVAQLDIRSNNTGVSYDCVLQDIGVSGTGGKITLFDNRSATGTYLYTTPFIMGPTDRAVCNTLGTPKANSDIELRFIMMDTQVGK